MAVAFVRGKQSGTNATSEIEITSPAENNMLVLFVTKSTEPDTAPKASDDVSGETGWTVNATKAKGNASAGSTWLATKKAVGTDKKLKATGGTIQGLSYLEVSGSSEAIDKITVTDNPGLAKANTTSSYTSTDAGDFLAVGVGSCQGSPSGALEAWGGTGPKLENVETGTTRCWSGWVVPGEAISAKTFTTNHVTERNPGMLTVTFKPAGGEVLKPKAEIVLSLKDVPTVVQQLNVTMTARFVLDDRFAPLQALAAALQTKLTLRESTAILQTTAATFTSRMVLKEEISGTVSIKFITGFTVGLTLADKISAQQLLKASPTARLVIGENITAAQAAKIAMTSQLNLRSTIAAKVKEGVTSQRVTIFIFEE